MAIPIGRITRRQDYLRVAGTRRKAVTPGLIVQIADGVPDQARFGITCSRKVGNAVQRNRAKRRLRALVRAVLGEQGSAGRDYVLIGRPATVERPYGDLLNDLSGALRRLNNGERRARP